MTVADQPSLFPAGAAQLGFTRASPPDGLPAPTVVALHGGLASGRLTFGPVLASWSRRLDVWVPDRRGYERTPEPARGSILEQAGDLLAFLDVHTGGRAHVVAASFGGVVALTAMQERPSAFRSLTVLEPPALTLVSDDPEVERWRADLQRTWERIDDDPEAVLRRSLARSDPGSLERMLRLLKQGDPGVTAVREEMRTWLTPLTVEGVRDLGVPCLVVSGGRSVPIFRRIAEHVAAALDAPHLVIEGAGHAVHLSGRRLLDPLRAHIAAAEARAASSEPVRLLPHDPGWARVYELERGAIARALGSRATAIEHIGSTAVPGLAAKPIVDILVGLEGMDEADEVVERLEAIGYACWREEPPSGRAGGAAASPPDPAQRRFLLRAADGRRRFHVHVVARGGPLWRERIAFRDALRADPALRSRYEAHKRALAEQHSADREAYSAAKGPVVAELLAALDRG